jgi:2,4-dienoyl-CoA reductase-like NADH-dependent reductase (Old Yellow Enzyme family)/thioredoxin reductase
MCIWYGASVQNASLFQPLDIGGIRLANRIVMPPMGTGLPDHDGHANEATIAYYRRRARGGVGLICVEASLVSPGGSAIGPELRLHDDVFIPRLRDLTDAIHDEGVPVGIQLWHPGRQTLHGEPVAPSAVPLTPRTPIPRVLSRDDIDVITSDFAAAARRSREAGFDFVEIHAAHCYLPCEFLSPQCNLRDDEYGGSLANRARFLLDIVAAIRAACGDDFPIFCRVSGDEGSEDGLSIEESARVCRWLVEAGVACLSVTAGSWYSLHLTIPPMSMPRGCHVEIAARIKQQVSVPVIAVGRLDDWTMAERVLQDGHADLIAVGRGLIADPDWPMKVRQQRSQEIRPCIACNACLDLLTRGERARCAVNPEVGHDHEWHVTPTTDPRRIMVVGSGPAGMEAARWARTRGHAVSIWEQAAQLGGKLDVASRAPSKADVLRFRDYQARVLEELGVEIHTDTDVTAAVVSDEDPDVVVVATGAEPHIPPIPGIHAPNVIDAQDILLGRVTVQSQDRVVIVGGSATGCETAEFLMATAAELSILEMEATVGRGVELITRQRLLKDLRDGGVDIVTESKVVLIEPQRVVFERPDGSLGEIEADLVALAIGWRPRGPVLADALGVRDVRVLGDASQPADFVAAVSAGAEAGLQV